jgi:hypothetical protein
VLPQTFPEPAEQMFTQSLPVARLPECF